MTIAALTRCLFNMLQYALIPLSHEKYKDTLGGTSLKGAILKCDRVGTSSGRLCHLACLCHLHHLCVVCAIYNSTPPLLPHAPDTDGPLDGGQSGKSRSCKNSNPGFSLPFILFSVLSGALSIYICHYWSATSVICFLFFSLSHLMHWQNSMQINTTHPTQHNTWLNCLNNFY